MRERPRGLTYRRPVGSSWGGPALAALFVCWLCYYVPVRLRLRQQVADARTEDRFSDGLRVLAVAGGDPVAAPEPRAVTGSVPLLTSRASQVGAGAPNAAGAEERSASMPEDDTHARTSNARTSPAPTAPARATAGGRAAGSPTLSLLERRAAAARRRLLVTVAALVATLVVGGLAVARLAPAWAVAVPAAVLVGVLVLGRRAVVAEKRADAARSQAARLAAQQRAVAARRARLGSPLAPRYSGRTTITGVAVHASSTSTQMIPRVTSAELARVAGVGADGASAVSRQRTRRAATGSAVPEAPGARTTVGSAGAATTGAAAAAGANTASDATASDAAGSDAAGSDSTWEAAAVPPPTYTMKPAARAPRAASADTPAVAAPLPAPVDPRTLAGLEAPGSVTLPGRAGTSDEGPATSSTASGEAGTAGDEPRPTTETLGISLDAILARRRAVGQ